MPPEADPAAPATGTTLATSVAPAPVADQAVTQSVADPAAGVDPAKTPDPLDKAADPAKTEEAPKEPDTTVPEKYEFKAPEGKELDPAAVEAFSPIAKDLKLTNDQAQKLVDLYAAQSAKAVETQTAAWKAVTDEWKATAQTDKDYGGAKFAENMGVVAKGLDKFGTPGLRKALDDSGMGDHPEVVRFLYNVGKASAEGGFPSGNAGGGGAAKTDAELMFPGLTR